MWEDILLIKWFCLGFMYNLDFEYMVGLKYVLNKFFFLFVYYDSDMGFGGGFIFMY